MSLLLGKAACEDAKRREDLASSDAALEAERLADDVSANVNKAAKAHQRNDASAAAAQMQWLDAMRRAGW